MICTDTVPPLHTSELRCCRICIHVKYLEKWRHTQFEKGAKVPRCPHCRQIEVGHRWVRVLSMWSRKMSYYSSIKVKYPAYSKSNLGKCFIVCVYRTVSDLTKEEFMNEVRFTWRERPFWIGEDNVEDSPIVLGYWGILEDWAEPSNKKKYFLGSSRVQVMQRIKMLLSF